MINYDLINKSIEYYESKGFTRIEAPWTVSEYVDNITKPEDVISMQLKHNDKCLVGSGEQSFLYLYLKEFLPKGKFQTVTPCFRYEPFGFAKSKYFLKNELINTEKVDTKELGKMVDIALDFFGQFLPVDVLTTDEGYDIICGGMELGSYGIRQTDFLEWIYGTGCAEPRLSSLMYGVSQKKN